MLSEEQIREWLKQEEDNPYCRSERDEAVIATLKRVLEGNE